jgi:hypothetical protein
VSPGAGTEASETLALFADAVGLPDLADVLNSNFLNRRQSCFVAFVRSTASAAFMRPEVQ